MIITSPRNGVLEYNFKDHVKNDTYSGVLMQLKNKVTSTPIDLRDVQTISLLFKLTYDGATALEINNTNSVPLITITDALNGYFIIGEGVIAINAGRYLYDATFTYVDGTVKTYFKGTWNILQNV